MSNQQYVHLFPKPKFRYNDSMADFETFGSQEGRNESQETTKKQLEELAKKVEANPRLERVPGAELLTRKVIVTSPCDVRLANGTNGRITNVPAIFHVESIGNEGRTLELADENGRYFGTIERRNAQDWNTRFVCTLSGEQARLFRTFGNARSGGESVPIPEAMRGGAFFPVLESRSDDNDTYFLVGRPLPPYHETQLQFPVWVCDLVQTRARIGVLASSNELETVANGLEFNIKRLRPFRDIGARNSREAELRGILESIQNVLWPIFSGQENPRITMANSRAVLSDLPMGSSTFDPLLVRRMQVMTQSECDTFFGRYEEAVKIIRSAISGNDGVTLHRNGTEEGRNDWRFIRRQDLP